MFDKSNDGDMTMGMDVFGKQPTAPEGEHFRRNVWSWRPLAHMVTGMCPDETAACKYWQSNDGDGLNAADAAKLADRLDALLADGWIDRYVAVRDASLAALPDETCPICGGGGIRNNGVVNAPCNACHGKGARRPTDTWYALNTDDVRDFAKFLRVCGGFEIC